MIKRPVKIEVAQNSSKRNVLNSSILSNQDFNSMSFSTRSNQNYSQSSGTIDAFSDPSGSEIQGMNIPVPDYGVNLDDGLNIDVSFDGSLDTGAVSSRFQERVGLSFEGVEERIQQREREIRQEFSGDCFFVNFDIFEDDQTTNLKKIDNIDIGSILTSNNAYVPDNVFNFYISFTNKNINDIQHLSYINPKIKLVNENNFNDIKNINLDIINNFYSKLSFKASKIFSKIPNIVTFVDQKLNNTYNTIVDFNDKISISIQKLNDFYLKYNYANKIEEFLTNENKNKNFIGQIYENSQFDPENVSFYKERQNDNLQSLQTNEVNISDLVSKNESNYNSLLISNFLNIHNDILDTDSFVTQQIINLSCSFFTFYPSFYSSIYSTNFLNTQKLNTKYSKVCINTSNVYDKNVFNYINESSNSIKKDLVIDTRNICIPVETLNNQNGITKNLNFNTEFVDDGSFNINSEISNIEVVNIVDIGDSGSNQNEYVLLELQNKSKSDIRQDISNIRQYVNGSDQINQKMPFYIIRQSYLNLFNPDLGYLNEPLLLKENLLFLKDISTIIDENFIRTMAQNQIKNDFFSTISNREFSLFNYIFLKTDISVFEEQKFNSGLITFYFKNYLSYILDEKHNEIVNEYIESNNWNQEFSLNNFYFEMSNQENYSDRQKTNEIIKIFRNEFLNIPSNSIIPTDINFDTSVFIRIFMDESYHLQNEWFMYYIESSVDFVDFINVLTMSGRRETIDLRNAIYLDVNKLFMSIDFCKFFIYFVSKKLKESFVNYINSIKSLLRYIASSNQIDAELNESSSKSLYEILNDNSFYLTGILTKDFIHKRKNSLIVKNLWGGINNILQKPNNVKFDYLSKENLVLNSSKIFIDCDALVKRLKLDLMNKKNVDLSIFKDTIKSIKNKNNQKYLASFSNESNSNVFAYKDDTVFKTIFKNNDESSYSYFNFFNNSIQKDMNIYNTGFFINENLENDVYNNNLNIIQDITKNYYPKNIFYNTTTFMSSVYQNINNYFNKDNLKNDLVLQYLYFCCFEDNIDINSQSKPINKDKIVNRFFKKALSLRDEVTNSSLKRGSVGYSFDQTDINRTDFESEEDFFEEVLNTNEDYKKLIKSVFSFNKNIAKSAEAFRLYNLRSYLRSNMSFRIIDDNISIPMTEESSINNISRNNIVDVEYYTFPFKRFSKDFLLTYFEDRSFKESINIVKRFNVKIDDELPVLSVSEEHKQLCDFSKDSDGNNIEISITYRQQPNIIKNNHSTIIDEFDKICNQEDSIFNIIIKKINLVIDYTSDISDLSISSLSDIEDFIENNKFVEDYISSLLEIYAEMYNLNFRRLEINSYNQEINNRSRYVLNENNNYLYENEVSNAEAFRSIFDADTFYDIKNISEIEIEKLSGDTFNLDLSQSRLFENNFYDIKNNNLFLNNTSMFFNKQLNIANLSDKLQSFTLDLLNGFFVKQKEFYENNLGLEIDLFELNEIIDNFQLDKSLYTNLSKKSFLMSLVEKVNKEVYNKKSLFKYFIIGKDNNEIVDYYIDNTDKFFINLKKDQNYLTNILNYKNQNDYKNSILSVVIPNNLVDKIDSSHGIKISLKYVPHKDLSENSDLTLHGVYSEYEKTFLPYFRNLNNLYYSRDTEKNYQSNYLAFYNEKDIFNKKYSILNSDSIESESLKLIANNHHESSRYHNIYNTFYNNNLNSDGFSTINFYNNRIIDIDLYNFIINLRDRDFNLISRISKELFQENVNIINEKYVEIPSIKFCIDNNIFIYDVLFEINKNISISGYEKAFVEKQIFDIYFIPLSESLSIDGKTYYSEYTIDNTIIQQ